MAFFPFVILLVLVSATPKDVFLSFRGRETRTGFTGHLFTALDEAGIPTFIDEDGIQRGENIYSEIERAINESKMSIILFSRLYATSTYCLEELVTIMERRRTVGLHVVPIFYMVSPSEVREQTGRYGQAFAEHEKQFIGEIHKVVQWRAVLREVTDLAGMVFKDGCSEVEFIKEIVEVVQNALNYIAPVVEKKLNDKVRSVSSYFLNWVRFLVIKMKGFLLFILLSLVLISRVCLFGTTDYAFVSTGGTDSEEFTSDLNAALIQSGIHTYTDNTRINRGESRWLKIRKAIYISKISVVVFSKDYASSKWCLDELLVIMERKRTDDGYIVVPIFYDVNPSEVQKQTGAYWDVFGRHQNKFKAGVVKEWRAALKEAADQHGVTLRDRGKDTRGSFTEHLYTALTRAGIHTFKYDKGIRRGENMTLATDRAINKSKVSIIVFSKNYASSTRCLNELVTIMERRRTAELFAIPIFYKVDPAEVEDQTKRYGEAFSKHKERFKEDMDRVERWRGSLKEATSLAGMVLHDRSEMRETQFIQNVVKVVQNKLNSALPIVPPCQNCISLIPTLWNQRGGNIYSEIHRSIKVSKISKSLFSKLYATSTYYLDELVMIMERRRTAGLHAMPNLYKVTPSEVREQTGRYGQAFAENEKQFKGEIRMVEQGRAALREATDLSGIVFKDGWSEVEFIKEIVEVIRNELNYIAQVIEKELNAKVRRGAPYFFNWARFLVIKMKGFLLFILLSLVLIARVCLFGPTDYAFVSIGGTDSEEFISALNAALIRSGIRTYRDRIRINKRESSWLKIRKAIYISKMSIVVFSKDYASSKWCLDELLVIMERKRNDDGYTVVPIFYDLDPSEVQKQTGAYKGVFARHRKCFKAGVVKEWRTALKEAADQLDRVTLRDRWDPQFIQDIAKMIGKKLNKTVKMDYNSLHFSWSRVSNILEKLLNNMIVRFFAEAILPKSPKGGNKNLERRI